MIVVHQSNINSDAGAHTLYWIINPTIQGKIGAATGGAAVANLYMHKLTGVGK